MTDRTPWFAECGKCGERWKFATLPLEFGCFVFRVSCPNCNERKKVYSCCTAGSNAVTEPRLGRVVSE